MSKSCSGKINKTRYDDPGKPMKQTSFIVKNLGGNLPKKQSTIVKRSFKSSTKPLSLDSTIPVDELTTKTSTASKPLHSSIYERYPFCYTDLSMWLTPLHEFQYVTHSPAWGRRMLVAKFFTSSTMKIKKMFGHKILWCTYTTISSQEWWTRAKLCLRLQIA